jgi:hypothetical protein
MSALDFYKIQLNNAVLNNQKTNHKSAPIGALALIVPFKGANYSIDAYISFGEYDEAKECDSFGVPDDKIFYYCENESELKEHKTYTGYEDDFRVLSYELIYS